MITITILIILAGVSIKVLFDQDGIIAKAKQAKQDYDTAKSEEETTLSQLYGKMNEEYPNANKEDGQTATDTTATATEGDILETKTAWVNGSKITGTMKNDGELNWKPTTATTQEVEAGYYSGGTLYASEAYNAGYNAASSEAKLEWVVTSHELQKDSRYATLTVNIGTGWDYVYWAFNNVTCAGTNYGSDSDKVERFNGGSYNKDTGVVTLQTFSPNYTSVNIVIIRCKIAK